MSRYLLDTNACVEYLRNSSPNIVQRIQSTPPSSLFLCSIVIAELHYGAYKSASPVANLHLLRSFVSQFIRLPVDEQTAALSGQLRAALESRGTPIGPYDLLIAATALQHGLTVVTNNLSEFSRVPNLTMESWQ